MKPRRGSTYFFEALRAGASGYLLKAADRDLVEARRATTRGEPFFCPDAVTPLIRDWLERARDGELPPDRRGDSSREFAELLVISDKTVERHLAIVLEKLGMRDRVDLMPTRSVAGLRA